MCIRDRTKDILKYLGEHKREGQILCGFAMETEELLANARKKLESKNCDLICANSLRAEGAGFGTDTNRVTVLTKEEEISLELLTDVYKRQEKTVRECLDKQQDGIVILPKGMPWKAMLIPSEALYVVYPSPRGGYNAQAIPKAIDTQECKKPFPKRWRGERDKLSEIAGIPGVTFCHIHGYLLGTETREAAVEACLKAMK